MRQAKFKRTTTCRACSIFTLITCHLLCTVAFEDGNLMKITPGEEKKDIALKLTILKEILEPLQALVTDINILLKQGNSWIENSDDKTYAEMKQLLESETSKFLKRCSSIASNGPWMFSELALKKKQVNQAKNSGEVANSRRSDENDEVYLSEEIEELFETVTSHSELFKTIQKKLKNQEKKIEEFSQKFVNYLEHRDSSDNEKEKEIKRLASDLATANKMLSQGGCEILPLKIEKVKIEDLDKYRLISLEDLKKCIETVKRITAGLNDKDFVHEYYQHLQISSYTGQEFKLKISQLLHNIDFDLQFPDPQLMFWQEYIHCLNK